MAEIDAVSDYWFDHEELGNRTEATKIGYKAMLAASQERTLRKVIDIAIKGAEQMLTEEQIIATIKERGNCRRSR